MAKRQSLDDFTSGLNLPASKRAAGNTTATFDLKPEPEWLRDTTKLVSEAKEINSINDTEQSLKASGLLTRIQKHRRAIQDRFKARRKPLNDAKTKLSEQETEALDPLIPVERALTQLIQNFQRREAQERAERAERERAEREERARAEQAARAEEILRAAAAAPTKRVAAMLERQAETIANAQPHTDPVTSEEQPQTLAKGMYSREDWHGAVHNAEALVLQIAAQRMIAKYGAPPAVAAWLQQFKPNAQASMELVMPQMKNVNSLASKLRSDLMLEGVTAEKDSSLVGR